MLKKYLKPGHTAIYIDASNLFFSEKTLGWNINFEKLYKYLNTETKSKRIRYYTPFKAQDKKQKKFLDLLSSVGYLLTRKEIKIIKNREHKTVAVKGNLDIELALDIFEESKKYKNIILFSGDSDFETLLKRLETKGKNIIIIATKRSISSELRKIGNFIDLQQLRPFIHFDPTATPTPLHTIYNPDEEILFFINV